MKAVWIQDYNIFTHGGGAEMSDRATFGEGLRRGHDLRLSNPPEVELTGMDAAIISNASLFPPRVIQEVVQRVPTVFYLHDYVFGCHHRLYYPGADRCFTVCPQTAWAEQVLSKAELLIWLSPLHRQAWLKKHPNLEPVPHHLHPSPIDPVPFEEAAKTQVRQPGTVISLNSLLSFKGKDNCIKYAEQHRDLTFTFVGGAEPGTALPPNCRVMPGVSYTHLPMLLAESESFLHLPQSPMPFDRSPVEAALAGCKLIVNDLVGCMSYGWKTREEMRKAVTESPAKFWARIEEVLGGH